MFSFYSFYNRYKGNKCYAKGNIEECIKYYKEACKPKSAPIKVRIIYGNLLLKDGQMTEAEEAFNSIPKKSLKERDLILLNYHDI